MTPTSTTLSVLHMHSLSYFALDTVACDCTAYSYVPAFSLHLAQHDGMVVIIWLGITLSFVQRDLHVVCKDACGFLVYYVAVGVGALCTLMIINHMAVLVFLCPMLGLYLRMAPDIAVSGRAIYVRHHWILLMHILIILVLDAYTMVDLLL